MHDPVIVLVIIDMGDFAKVLEVVESVSDWKRLGVTLGLLYHPTLTGIETHRHYKQDDCIKDLLSAWLEQKDDAGVPSWSVLKSSLQEIGEHKLAHQIVS